jgi:UPF0176 protein
MNINNYRVLLYYKFVKIEDPERFAQNHLEFCKNLGVLGRIIIASEGLNGTISGTYEQTEAYMNEMHKDPRFTDLEFKIDEFSGHVFKKLHVRHKKEIVTFRSEYDINPNQFTGKYLEPADFENALQEDGVVILDGRTDFEYDLGHFKNAVRPEVKSFREFPQWIKKNFSQYKGKKVLTYCTGGIRCEKLSVFMIKEGFKNVCQLHGGIIKYSKDPKVKGKLFEGKCYVFDERISIPVNYTEEYTVTGKCHHCGKPTDRYVNCANIDCHKQHFECEECEVKWKRSCSKECLEAKRHELNTSI